MIKRREFITFIGGAAAWPIAARAQQAAMPVIGFLSSRSPGESAGVVLAFRQGLREVGFVEGRNVIIAFRWAEGRYDRLPELAEELVALPVAVLFTAGGQPSAFAAKAATQTIPVVFSAAIDPDQIGLVASLNRPGGNITGMSIYPSEIAAKSVQLLKELLPTATVIGYLVNPMNPTAVEVYTKEASSAAGALGITIQVLNASTEHDLDAGGAESSTGRVRRNRPAVQHPRRFPSRSSYPSGSRRPWRTARQYPQPQLRGSRFPNGAPTSPAVARVQLMETRREKRRRI